MEATLTFYSTLSTHTHIDTPTVSLLKDSSHFVPTHKSSEAIKNKVWQHLLPRSTDKSTYQEEEVATLKSCNCKFQNFKMSLYDGEDVSLNVPGWCLQRSAILLLPQNEPEQRQCLHII